MVVVVVALVINDGDAGRRGFWDGDAGFLLDFLGFDMAASIGLSGSMDFLNFLLGSPVVLPISKQLYIIVARFRQVVNNNIQSHAKI